MSKSDKLILLIKEYITCASYSCRLLRELYTGKESLMYAWKVMKVIPKEGYIEGVYFSFHGRGCYFEYENGSDSIDIDFGPEDRCDGFDTFRLSSFLQYRKNRYAEFLDEKVLEQCFSILIEGGIIKKHPLDRNSHLYYLATSLDRNG